jgi:hypothetical protein
MTDRSPDGAVIAFRAPTDLAERANAAAARELMTRSVWLRRLVDRAVREPAA